MAARNTGLSKFASATAIATMLVSIPNAAMAQDAKTYGDAFAIPVFEQIDQNGVDLLSGMLRVTSPTITTGSEEATQVAGLQWTGRSWSLIDVPSIWKKDGNYIVNYNGQSEEFDGYNGNYAQKKPITGSTLRCGVWPEFKITSYCIYTSRDGDVVRFQGPATPFVFIPYNIGELGYPFGNLGILEISVRSIDNRNKGYGSSTSNIVMNGATTSSRYYNRDVRYNLGGRSVKITTPNHADDDEEHFLRPKNTIQTFTDEAGSQWRYSFNSDRELTRIEVPGGTAAVNITYDSNHRVKTVTNADGTWNYNWSTPGDFRTVTVTDPLGNSTYVKSHKDRGYVTEFRDPLLRWTYYSYNSDYRLTRVTYPDLNYVNLAYDARGNVTMRQMVGKPGSGTPTLTERAGYPATCTVSPICNKPLYTIDAKGARTDFEYETPTAVVITTNTPNSFTRLMGTGKPITITSPAPTAGAVRPQIRNTYTSGVLVESAYCKTQSSCAGTADEVKTTYDYNGTEAVWRLLFGLAVTADGQTLRTCYGYSLGWRISETPPRAGLSSCPSATTDALPPLTAPPAGGGGSGGGGPPDEEDCGTGGQVCN